AMDGVHAVEPGGGRAWRRGVHAPEALGLHRPPDSRRPHQATPRAATGGGPRRYKARRCAGSAGRAVTRPAVNGSWECGDSSPLWLPLSTRLVARSAEKKRKAVIHHRTPKGSMATSRANKYPHPCSPPGPTLAGTIDGEPAARRSEVW